MTWWPAGAPPQPTKVLKEARPPRPARVCDRPGSPGWSAASRSFSTLAGSRDRSSGCQSNPWCSSQVLMSISSPPFTTHFSTLASAYDVVLCDVWGVVHNSLVAFADACTALTRFRRQGGSVVLITNAPRPAEVVMALLDGLEVPRAAYDAIVSSGDVTRAIIAARAGQSAFHVGPTRD